MLLKRCQVDWLVCHYPNYMVNGWQKLKRQWFLGGVRVSGSSEQIAELSALMGRGES